MVVTHEVQSGETLENIARRFGTTTTEILNVNEIPDRQVRAGMVIRIPILIIPPTVPSRRPFRNFAARLIGRILFVFSTNRFLFQRNQPVGLELIKTNVSNRPITLTYNTAQRFDFFVRRGVGGRILWQWSADRVFSQVVSRVTLRPGESQVFRATWDQRTNEGNRVPPGVYTVQAENVARELQGRLVSVRIRIV